DSLVVALGSDISNHTEKYPTETTLFQNYLVNKDDVIYVNGNKVNSFPYINKAPIFTVLDNRSIGYYIPGRQALTVFKQPQTSRDQKDLKDTQGNFAGLYINHGKAPKNAEYEYAMLIGTDSGKLSDFATQMKGKHAVYTVLQKDSIMHSVKYHPQNMTGLSIFKSDTKLTDRYVIETSRPALVMYKEQANSLTLAVVDPDLAFYEGEDDTPRNADGTRKEVSIYSRTWFKTPSQPSVMKLMIKG